MGELNLDIKNLWIPKFDDVFYDVIEHNYTNFIFPGGRGSTKSSFVGGLCLPITLIQNKEAHACVFRQVGNTLKTSVYAQIEWGISELGLYDYFIFHTNPLEIIFKPTGQKILFLGLDDPGKVKSIKLPFGYIGITWFEELDQMGGEAAIRKVLQSTMRGGEDYWNFMSYNPPISLNNWANEYTARVEEKRRYDSKVIRTTYLDVPEDWLGQAFINEADYIKEVNPRAYQNEYLGIPVGTGGNIFDNAEDMVMSNELISQFDKIYNGLDWGFAEDPLRFVKVHFDKTRRDLYIFGEHNAKRQTNGPAFKSIYEETKLKRRHFEIVDDKEVITWLDKPLMELNELVTADSAEPKSIADFKAWGAFIRGAVKGNDSVAYGIKWLQSLRHIYIDKDRCPYTYDEFMRYEYERDREGNIISSYPDRDNHSIDAVRYALERVYRVRGE